MTGGALQGDWDCAFWVDVPFPLQSKSNFRRGNLRAGRDWKSLTAFEDSLGLLVRAQLPQAWRCGDPAEPLPDRPTVVVSIVARSLIDAANFSKSVLDACEGIVFISDASVSAVSSIGIRGRADQRAVIAFAQVGRRCSPTQLAGVSAALDGQASALAESLWGLTGD